MSDFLSWNDVLQKLAVAAIGFELPVSPQNGSSVAPPTVIVRVYADEKEEARDE